AGAAAVWARISLLPSRISKPAGTACRWIMACRSILGQPGIDDEIGARRAATFVRAQKQRHARDMAGIEPEFERLEVEELLIEFGREPELLLPFGQDCAGNDAVDADRLRAEF